MRGEDVEATQVFLREARLYAGAIDGVAGPIWKAAAKFLQQARMIDDDGRYGPQTRGMQLQCAKEGWTFGETWNYRGVPVYGWRHPTRGLIPARQGGLSHFGGPDDPDDRKLGQALLGDSLPRARRRFPELFRLGVLRDVDAIPEGMGLSWALDREEGHYCAMRWRRGSYPSPHADRVLAFTDAAAVAVVPTDYGPAARWWFVKRGWDPKVFDTSKAALRHLERVTNQKARYCWAAPGAYGPQAFAAA